jgi:hypothetical protein
VGYYILDQRRFLAPSGQRIAGDAPSAGPTLPETWQALRAAITDTFGVHTLGAGLLDAPGNLPDEERRARDGICDGRLQLPAPCRFCSFGGLCGRDFPATEAEP